MRVCFIFHIDQGFEDTENSNFITGQYPPHGHSPIIAPHLAIETQHASLKRKKHKEGEAQDGGSVLDMSPGVQVDLSQHRPLSMVVGSQNDASMSISTSTGSLSRQVYVSCVGLFGKLRTFVNSLFKRKYLMEPGLLCWIKNSFRKVGYS